MADHRRAQLPYAGFTVTRPSLQDCRLSAGKQETGAPSGSQGLAAAPWRDAGQAPGDTCRSVRRLWDDSGKEARSQSDANDHTAELSVPRLCPCIRQLCKWRQRNYPVTILAIGETRAQSCLRPFRLATTSVWALRRPDHRVTARYRRTQALRAGILQLRTAWMRSDD